MCVLTRNHAPQEKLKTVFEAYNIPAMITIDHGFYPTNPAIQIVISTLKAIEDLTSRHFFMCLFDITCIQCTFF